MTASEKLAVIIERQENIGDAIGDIKDRQGQLNDKFDAHAQADNTRFNGLEKFNGKVALLGTLALVLLPVLMSFVPKLVLGDGSDKIKQIVERLQKNNEAQEHRLELLINELKRKP